MPQFRKKPVVIDAVRWNGKDVGPDAPGWFLNPYGVTIVRYGSKLRVRTIEGDVTASEGDWIIRGIAGEIYPCRADIFEATYEAVPEDRRGE